jgi:D-alanyl-D-alanine carboxypeptidase (penicillin-binding protein 5/6)
MIAVDWLPPNALVPVGADAANVTPDRVGMKVGQEWPLAITMRALLIDSANDAAYALADKVSGSLARFAVTMKFAAEQIGLQDHPVLHDPAGLDGTEGYAGGNRVSAWDLAVAARDLMANPELAAIVGTRVYDFTGPDGIVYSLASHNLTFLQTYPGAIGVKTGYTDRAGLCVVEEADRNGRRMMAVVLNSTDPDADATYLLNKGFAIPVRAESAHAAVLPPIVEPEPPVAVPHMRLDEPGLGDIPLQPQPVDTAVTVPAQSLASSYGLETAVGTGIVLVVLLVGRGVRRRRRPAGAHSLGSR